MTTKTLKRISVDFNTLNSEPVGIVKLGEDGTANGERIQPVNPGQRVILYMDELEFEATILYEDGYWMAQPDEATWREIVPED